MRATPLTAASRRSAGSRLPGPPGHGARESSALGPHAAPASRAPAWHLRQAWRRGGRRKRGAGSQLTAPWARPREKAEGNSNLQITVQLSFLPTLPAPKRGARFLVILGLCSDLTQTRSHYFFKQKQLDVNSGLFASAPWKQWEVGVGEKGKRETGGGGLHLPNATAGSRCHCASHIWPSSAAAAAPSPPAPGTRAPQPARRRAHRSPRPRPGERRTRYSLYLGSCPYMAMCASARRAAAPYKGTRRAPG